MIRGSEQKQAYSMVGEAIVAGIQLALIEPVINSEIRAVVRWLDAWLSPAEKEIVARHLGVDFGAPASPSPPITDAERYDRAMREHVCCLVGKAIVLRIRHTEIDRADPDIVAVIRWLDQVFLRTQKEFITRHAPIEFDAPSRPLLRFTDYVPPF